MNLYQALRTALLATALSTTLLSMADTRYTAIAGKDGWLFYANEFNPMIESLGADSSIALIGDFNRVLQNKGIQLVVMLVPVKARIYNSQLPDDITWSDAQEKRYANYIQSLRQSGVWTVDLYTPFFKSPLRDSATPLFFRLDSHWSPEGAELAAVTVQSELAANTQAADSLANASPLVMRRFKSGGLHTFKTRDLVAQLPPTEATQEFPLETFYRVIYQRPAVAGSLTASTAAPVVTLVGSSYSAEWTGFANELRARLQRDVLRVDFPATLGQWWGMLSYLKDDAFKTSPPKILIWEIPERDLYAPPSFAYREARYRLPDAQWLQSVTRLVERVGGK